MSQKVINNGSKGVAPIDPKSMDIRDVAEAAYMLQATSTLLRQSFGIVSFTNTLQDKPFTDDELKDFARCFDVVHKTCNVLGAALSKYVNDNKDTKYGFHRPVKGN